MEVSALVGRVSSKKVVSESIGGALYFEPADSEHPTPKTIAEIAVLDTEQYHQHSKTTHSTSNHTPQNLIHWHLFYLFWNSVHQISKQSTTSWWFQPISQTLVKLDHFPTHRGENKNM